MAANKNELPSVAYERRDTIALPDGTTYQNAIDALTRAQEYANTPADVWEDLGAPAWYALVSAWKVLKAAGAIPVPTKHAEIAVSTPRGPLTAMSGWLGLPDGSTVELRVSHPGGNRAPSAVARFRALPGRHDYCRALAARARKAYADDPCTRGGALSLRVDEDGNLDNGSPWPVLAIHRVSPEEIVLPRELDRAVRAYLFGFIRDPQARIKAGTRPQRSALLVGHPGTGKSLTASACATLAADNGWTVLYATESAAAEAALEAAYGLAPALLILEDIDRAATASPDAVKRLQNLLDGLGDRPVPILILATSNNPERLPSPLIRPGRFDAVLRYPAPDADAAARLLAGYLPKGCALAKDKQAMAAIGQIGAGLLPASLREAASRATLYAVEEQADATAIDASALAATVRELRAQDELVHAKMRAESEPTYPTLRVLASPPETPEGASPDLRPVARVLRDAHAQAVGANPS